MGESIGLAGDERVGEEEEGMLLLVCSVPGCWALFMMRVGVRVGVFGHHIRFCGRKFRPKNSIQFKIQIPEKGNNHPKIQISSSGPVCTCNKLLKFSGTQTS